MIPTDAQRRWLEELQKIGDEVKLMADETVTICAGCNANRYCREYKGIWLCLSGPWHCWKHREIIHANKRNEEEKEQ